MNAVHAYHSTDAIFAQIIKPCQRYFTAQKLACNGSYKRVLEEQRIQTNGPKFRQAPPDDQSDGFCLESFLIAIAA